MAIILGGGVLLNLVTAMAGNGASSCLGLGFCLVTWPLSFAIPYLIAERAEEDSHEIRRNTHVPIIRNAALTTIKRSFWLISMFIALSLFTAIGLGLDPSWWLTRDSTFGPDYDYPDIFYTGNLAFWGVMWVALVSLLVLGLITGIWAGIVTKKEKIEYYGPLVSGFIIVALNISLTIVAFHYDLALLVLPYAIRIPLFTCVAPILILSGLFYGASRYSIFRIRRADHAIPTSSGSSPDS